MNGKFSPNSVEFQVVEDHRATLDSWAVGKPPNIKMKFRVRCACGEKSAVVGEARLAHDWHDIHRGDVIDRLSTRPVVDQPDIR